MNSIAIYGTKIEAEKTLYFCKSNRINCEYIIDNFEEGSFHGIKILKLDEVDIPLFCVVACSTYDTYKVIKTQLNAKGYLEFENFIWSRLWRKKIVVINANCHGTALIKYLEKSEEFTKEYAIYPVPEIQMNEEKEIEKNLLEHTDVYIHQDIRKDNCISYKLSDEYIVSLMRETTIDICIPNFVGLGNVYHQYSQEGGYATRGSGPILLFYQDTLLDEAYKALKNKKKITISEILEYEKNKKYQFDQKFEERLKVLKEREKNWDIKVCDYISEHRYDARLFCDINHPGNNLMTYICDKVIAILGFKTVDTDGYGMGAEAALSPYISSKISEFGQIRNDKKTISLSGSTITEYEEYVRQYIWLMYDDYLE